MKHLLAISVAAIALAACQPSGSDISESSDPALEVSAADLPQRQALPLPPFPDLPPAQTELRPGQDGEIYFPIHSPRKRGDREGPRV